MCVHEKKSIPTIQKIVAELDPALILETGTSWGGFTLVLHDGCQSAELHSYDKPNPDRVVTRRDLFDASLVHFHNVDILSTPVEQLIDLCKSNRRKLLYCDNGRKTKEIKLYAVHLNSGDMLGVHDWGIEIKYEDAKDVLKDFEPVELEIFESNNWTSRFWKRL